MFKKAMVVWKFPLMIINRYIIVNPSSIQDISSVE